MNASNSKFFHAIEIFHFISATQKQHRAGAASTKTEIFIAQVKTEGSTKTNTDDCDQRQQKWILKCS